METDTMYFSHYAFGRKKASKCFLECLLLLNVLFSTKAFMSRQMVDGETKPPPLLTEADLIGLMEKHGIGRKKNNKIEVTV